MNTRGIFVVFLMILLLLPCSAQEISRKERRKRIKLEKEALIKELIHSREFVFTASRALPQNGRSIDLTSNSNSIKFHPDRIESYMPFYGRAYQIDFNGEGGIKFEGKPTVFNIADKMRKGYEIKVVVPAAHENYQLNLFVSPDGSATLTINSISRAFISYYGNIGKIEALKEK